MQQPYTPHQPSPGELDRRQAASARARGLLLSFLNRRERKEFEKDKAISLRAASGTRYRIKWGRVANIDVLEGRRVSHRLCIHPADPSLPIEDVMLAQLLHLKTNEAEVLRIANRHPGADPRMRAAA